MRRLRALGCVTLVVAVAGCWPAPGQGPDRTGNNPFETTLAPDTVAGLHELWSVDPGAIVGSPVVSSAGVHVAAFVAPNEFALVTYGTDGSELWRAPIPPDAVQWVHATSGPWVVGDRVAAGYYVYENGFGNWADAPAFDIATGAPRGSLGDGPIVAVRDNLVVSTYRRDNGGPFHETGTRIRNVDTGQLTLVSRSDAGVFTLGKERLYRVLGNSVSAIDPTPAGAPQELWYTVVASTASEPVLNADESVLYISAGRTLTAIDTATGAVLWTGDLGSPGMTPALAGGDLFVQTTSGWLNVFQASGCGDIECPFYWQAAGGPGPVPTQPAVAGDLVYTAWGNGAIQARRRTGDWLWTGSAGTDPIAAGPIVSDGRLYVASTEGTLSAFGL